MGQKRDTFSSKLGFIFAAAGSAVGLGNLWRFPYFSCKIRWRNFHSRLPVACSQFRIYADDHRSISRT